MLLFLLGPDLSSGSSSDGRLIIELLDLELPGEHQGFFGAQIFYMHKVFDRDDVRGAALGHHFPQVPPEHLQSVSQSLVSHSCSE